MTPNRYGSIQNELEVEEGNDKSLVENKPKSTAWCRILVVSGCFILSYLAYRAIGSRIRRHKDKHNQHKHEKKLFFEDQLIDHFSSKPSNKRYSQKYYQDDEFFAGPGYPIFVIMGGEDPVDNILYPYISRHLGLRFGAITLCIEHRFYGDSRPIEFPSNNEMIRLLSLDQALADAVRLIKNKQEELGCGPRGSASYCPVMTVGGSYPGFLAVLMRIVYPEVVDIGYGSSSPLNLYAHNVDQYAYFEKITQVADHESPGCAAAVKEALMHVQNHLLESDSDHYVAHAAKLGICPDLIPAYISNNQILNEEIMMVIATRFAENDMGYYPPGPEQELVQGCQIFLNDTISAEEKVSNFLRMREEFEECFDMRSELPPGPNGTISAADWSGVGDGHSGFMWDFQSCTLIPECGMSEQSMFPPRPWSLSWLTDHCQNRFGYTPVRDALVQQFGFNDLSNTSRILFTNGLIDGWSIASITEDVSDTIVAINFPNGAHHSDLSHEGPSKADTPDIKEGHVRIANLIGDWLDQVREEYAEL